MEEIIKIYSHEARVLYDPDTKMYQGRIKYLIGCAEFYADNIEDLKKEGRKSLRIYNKLCQNKDICI